MQPMFRVYKVRNAAFEQKILQRQVSEYKMYTKWVFFSFSFYNMIMFCTSSMWVIILIMK